MVIDFPRSLEKINRKPGHSRRYSTGDGITKISEPLPIPNYLRASIGSCHDLCKYGFKRDAPPELITTKHKALGKKKLLPVPSSRQQPSESSPKPTARSDQSSVKQLNKPLLKSTKNVQTSQDHAGKGTRSVPHTSSSFPRSSGKESISRRSGTNDSSLEKDTKLEIKKSVENPETCQNTSSGKESIFRRSGKNASSSEKDTHLEIKKSVENSETCQNTSSGKESLSRRADKSSPKKDSRLEIKKSVEFENSETCQEPRYEDVPEKIIHCVEPNDVNWDEDLAPDGIQRRGVVSSPNQKQKLDSEAKSRSWGVRIGNIVPNESDSSSRRLKFTKNGKELEIVNVEADPMGINLRRVVSHGETIDPENNVTMRVALRHNAVTEKTTNPELMNAVIEETAGKRISKNKVKALVDAFETLMTVKDFESPRPCMRLV